MTQRARTKPYFGILVCALAIANALFGGVLATAYAQLSSGDVLVIDGRAGSGQHGAIFRVDPTTGVRTVLNDFGNSAQGPLGVSPIGLVFEASGQLLVIDQDAGTNFLGSLFRVDLATGVRTLVSDFGDNSQGPRGHSPTNVALGGLGQILVTDHRAGTMAGEDDGRGALFQVDPATGVRTIVSDFGNIAQGPLGSEPLGVALEASDQLLVADGTANVGPSPIILGALFRVDPTTGVRTVVSDFGDGSQGPLGHTPTGVAIEASNQILALNADAGADFRGILFRVDPVTGSRTIVSDFSDSSQGPLGVGQWAIALEGSGQILVMDPNAGTVVDPGELRGGRGALFRVDPTTGARTILSDFGDTAQGPLGVSAAGIVIVRSRSVYAFTGFFRPVDNGSILNVMKAGAAVPVKFSLSGDQGLSILAAGSPSSRAANCDDGSGSDNVDSTVTAGNSGLTYDASTDVYTYVWKTDKTWVGTCRELNVQLIDDTSHKALFKFTK
jgi:hypothetical protein